jgi:phage-related minor tail protein
MQETLDYLFFTKKITDRFIHALQQRNLQEGKHWQQQQEEIQQAYLIRVFETDDLTSQWDSLWDELDELFDQYTEEDQQAIEQSDDALVKSKAGVYIQLKNGQQTIASVNPDVLNRILSVLSNDEFAAFVDTIAKSVEQPDDRMICQR